MGAALGVGLASFCVLYHTPSIFGAILLPVAAVGAVHSALPWWSILIQIIVGSILGIALHIVFPTVNPNEPRFSLFAMPVTRSRFLLHWISSLTSTLCYGFLYYLDLPTARLVDPKHVFTPWVGPLTATALVLAIDAAMHMARRSFISTALHTPPVRGQVAAFIQIFVTVVDLLVHAEHWSTYLLPIIVVLLALQVYIAENEPTG